MNFVDLEPGDPAPLFRQSLVGGGGVNLEGVAGRWLVLAFLAPAARPADRQRLERLAAERDVFAERDIDVYGVTPGPPAAALRRSVEATALRVVADSDARISRAYGVLPVDQLVQGAVEPRGLWVILDAALRVHEKLPFAADGSDFDALLDRLRQLPPPGTVAGVEPPVPVIMIPNVFDAEFCRSLIELYESHGGEPTGVMRTIDGKTMRVQDAKQKIRRDHIITDQAVIRRTQELVQRRVAPEIAKIHQFRVTRMERYIVCCYDAAEGAHFRPHRDNTTKATEHRRFAVSVNLNDDFTGGEVGFPEFGARRFKAPAGAAVVFSCSLLHWVSPVTSGRRYAFLPFLYDDAAAQLRERNNAFLGQGVEPYKA